MSQDEGSVTLSKFTKLPTENGQAGVDLVEVIPEVTINGHREWAKGEKKVVEGGSDSNSGDKGETGNSRCVGCCGRKKAGRPTEAVSSAQLFQFATPLDKLLMVVGTLGAVCQGVTLPLNVAVFGKVIDVFVPQKGYNNTGSNSTSQYDDLTEDVMPYIYTFLGIGCGSFVSTCLEISCWQWAAERQVSTMRKMFFRSVMRQEIGWFDVHEAGEISSRFSEDVHKIADGMGDKMATFLQWMSTWLTAYIVAFTRSWKLTLAAALFSPILILFGTLVVRVMRKMASKEAKAYARAGAIAEQAFRAIRTVQAFQGQEKEIAKYEQNLTDAVKVGSNKGLALGLSMSCLWFVLFNIFAGVMWFGTHLIQQENLSPGSVIPVFLTIMVGSLSLGNAFNNLESFSNARGAASKVFAIIALKPDIDSSSKEGLRPDKLEGRIEFKNVRFSYPARPGVTILKDMSLTIEPGQHVALVGPSGCGKSTTIQLLQRFYDPQRGSLEVDGHNIRDLNLKWLREHIGVVSQEPALFDTSIEENIRFGKMDATDEEVEWAAKMANAHDFIKLLPEGYKTNVGERGAQLSGGQKQRISIARALVRNPRILLLDEATSALDHESEAVVQSALDKAKGGRTTITIAHRLSTVRHADKIMAISDGEVAEQGTHDEMVKSEGLYYQLVQIQTRLDKKSQLDIEDVEIVEEDEDDPHEVADDELLRKSFRRTLSGTSTTIVDKQINLVVRESRRRNGKKKQFFPVKKGNQNPGDIEYVDVKLSHIMHYNAPEWPLIIVGCFSSVIAGGIHPAFSFVLSEFIKMFGIHDKDEQWSKVTVLASAIVGVAFVSAMARTLQGFCLCKSGALLTARLRKLTFASIINQDMTFFDHPNNQVGALTSKLAGDCSLVHGATGSKVGQVLEAASTVGCALVIAFIFGWKLAFVVTSFLPLMILSGIILGRAVAGAAKKDRYHLEQAGKICSQVVDSIRTVVSLGREDFFIQKFDVLIDHTKASSRKMSFNFGLTYAMASCLLYFAYAVGFFYGSILVSDGEMEFYSVFRVFSAVIFGGMMAGRQASYGVDYSKAKLAAARVIALLNRMPQIDVRDKGGLILDNFRGGLSIRSAIYHYPSRPNIQVLDGLSLTINPGETVALVGASGCGKSTTTQLIERFYDVDSGAVEADGHDLKQLNLRWYRQQLGIVSQEPTLFDCSIAENIAYGDNSRVVPMDEIMQAARNANIHTFISSLPQGYDTNVGEKGTQLSGGQKQRVAIARALVRNPKVLLLDEATSALDTESEKIVQDALDKASEHRTCVTIAHRLSTIQNADQIAVVSKGKVTEIGTHTQLMTIKGTYYRLQKAQNRPRAA